MAFQDATLGLGAWSGNRLLEMHRSIFIEYSNTPTNLFFLVGIIWCARRCVTSMRQGVADVLFAPLA